MIFALFHAAARYTTAAKEIVLRKACGYIYAIGGEKRRIREPHCLVIVSIYSYEAPVGSATFQSAQRAHDDGSASPLDVMYIIVFSRSAKILIGAFYIHLSKTTAVGLPRFCMRCQYTRKISFACKK